MAKSVYKKFGILAGGLFIILAILMLAGCNIFSTTVDSIKVGDYDLKMGTYEGAQKEYDQNQKKFIKKGNKIEIFIDDKHVKLDDKEYKYTIKDNTITAGDIILEVKSNEKFIYQVGAGVEMNLVQWHSTTKDNSDD